jgi:hypothetical protein
MRNTTVETISVYRSSSSIVFDCTFNDSAICLGIVEIYVMTANRISFSLNWSKGPFNYYILKKWQDKIQLNLIGHGDEYGSY